MSSIGTVIYYMIRLGWFVPRLGTFLIEGKDRVPRALTERCSIMRRALQLPLGYTKMESTVRYLDIEVYDALVSSFARVGLGMA